MKKTILFLLLVLLSTGCVPAGPEILPIETVIALTMAAIPKTDTPTAAPVATVTPAPSATVEIIATPDSLLSIPGANCILPEAERVNGRVTRILNGESIEVAIGEALYTIRYLSVDAPDLLSADGLGAQSAGLNKELVGSQVVTLVRDISDTDEEGRLLRYVFVNNLFVNYQMVQSGMAFVSPAPPDLACLETLLAAEDQARVALQGIWKPTPIPSATNTLTPSPTSNVPTDTPVAPCDCEGDDLRCKDFDTFYDAQSCYQYCIDEGYGDVFDLDPDGDGSACEGRPR